MSFLVLEVKKLKTMDDLEANIHRILWNWKPDLNTKGQLSLIKL